MTDSIPALWHYTCGDAVHSIERDGLLRPWPHPILGEPVVWATDLDDPPATILGLGNLTAHLTCNRMAHRFRVIEPALFAPWCTYARRLPRTLRASLEAAPGALPRHWWVATVPIPVHRADRQRLPAFADLRGKGSA